MNLNSRTKKKINGMTKAHKGIIKIKQKLTSKLKI